MLQLERFTQRLLELLDLRKWTSYIALLDYLEIVDLECFGTDLEKCTGS